MASQNTLNKTLPKYLRVAESIRADIESGLLSPHDQLPSFNDMVEQFQVTKHTIDKAQAILEREGLVRREQGRGVFVEPQKVARTGNIGLLLWGIAQCDWYIQQLINGVQQQCQAHGLNLMLLNERTPVSSKNIDGILLFCSHFNIARLNIPERLPRVLLMSSTTGLEIANVVADDTNGAKLATRHLLELGHRRVSMLLATEDDPYSQQRLAGYCAALEEFGIPFDERLRFYINSVMPYHSNFLLGEDYMNAWLERGWEDLNSTAILCLNDGLVWGMTNALNRRGLQVPRDVSVVGFDGIGLPDDDGLPGDSKLTTIQVPIREIASCGTKLLLDQIEKGGHSVEKVVFPVRLVTGNSTRPLS